MRHGARMRRWMASASLPFTLMITTCRRQLDAKTNCNAGVLASSPHVYGIVIGQLYTQNFPYLMEWVLWIFNLFLHCVSKKTGPLLRFEITPTNCT